jgi:hypothetical protein
MNIARLNNGGPGRRRGADVIAMADVLASVRGWSTRIGLAKNSCAV